MKRKVISTLVAAAFGLTAGPAALAACPADGATPFTAGPVSPLNGFAEFVQDSNGVQLELCRQGDGANGLCFFDPVVAGNLFSQQIGFGAEAFWWLAEGSIQGNVNALVVMAAEAAFAAENPVNGQQFPFTRLRIRLDVPVAGTYVVTHPYGQSTYTVTTVGAGDEIRESFDVQFTPNQVNQGRVGPWLVNEGGPFADPNDPTGALVFIGDGAPRTATGSPCGTNFFKVEAVSPDGGVTPAAVIDPNDGDGDGSATSLTQDLFGIFGRMWDGKYNTPIVADRNSYDRPAVNGQVDSFATSVAVPHAQAATAVSVSGGANLPAGEQPLAGPDAAGRYSRSEVLTDAGILPATVAMTGSRADAATDPTTLLRAVTDVVRISKAEYNVETGLLTIMAASSDVAANPVLTVREFGAAVGPTGVGILTQVPPATVTVVSAKGGSDTEPVSVLAAAAGANQPPFATADSATTAEDTAVIVDVLANDGDADGDPILVVAVANAQNGTAVNNGTSVTFTPALNYNGNTASFEYQVSDGRGGSSGFVLATVNVLPVNDNPVAGNDTASTGEDAPVSIPAATLLVNDSDVDGDALTVSAVGNAVNGLAVLNGTDVVFTPATNFSGQASFQYTVSDGNGGSANGTVNVTVIAANDPPVARDDAAATAFQTPVTINVLANDADPEGSALTVATFTQGANGTVARSGNNLLYTPNTGFSGTDSFTYTVQDTGGATSNTANVTVTVGQPAQQVDLDINRLTVTGSVRVNRNQPVGIAMRVQNGGTVAGARTATVTGTMNGVQLYQQSIQVSDPVAGGTTNFAFPSYTPTTAGTINWRAEIFDDNPDVDVATATTTVR